MTYTAVVNGESVDLELSVEPSGAVTAQVGPVGQVGQMGPRNYTLQTIAVEPGVYWINWNNRSIEVRVVALAPDRYTVSTSGHSFEVSITDPRTAFRHASHDAHDGTIEIHAPMPGKIVRVLVAEGAEIQANAGLLVMEAMKMQNEIRSPKKGIVRKLSVSEGSAVSAGDLLATVE